MFRKKAIERMTSPESLDQLLVVVKPRAWLTLSSLAGLITVLVVWSFVGRIPVSVDGFGILIKPGHVRTIQSPGAGEITEVMVEIGDQITAGDVIARISQPDLVTELKQLLAKRRLLVTEHLDAERLAQAKYDLDMASLGDQRALLESRLRNVEALQKKLRVRTTEYNRTSMDTLFKSKRQLLELTAAFKKQLASIRHLRKKGLTDLSQELNAEKQVMDSKNRLAELDVRLEELRLRQIQDEQARLDAVSQISQFKHQLLELDVKKQQLEHQRQQDRNAWETKLRELDDSIERSRLSLHEQIVVRSPFSGHLLELDVSAGHIVSQGKSIAKINVEHQRPFFRLTLQDNTDHGTFTLSHKGHITAPIAYNATAAAVRDAIAALPHMKAEDVQVSVVGAAGAGARLPHVEMDITLLNLPLHAYHAKESDDTPLLQVAETQLFEVNGAPAVATLTRLGVVVADDPLEHLAYFDIKSGRQIKPGMKIYVTPSNVERERFGSMIGTVVSVSSFPVSSAAAVNVLGNQELAKSLIAQGGGIVVATRLDTDPANRWNGFKWTGQGPKITIVGGTTTTCRVTVEQRAPITYAIPLLRTWALGQKDDVKPRI